MLKLTLLPLPLPPAAPLMPLSKRTPDVPLPLLGLTGAFAPATPDVSIPSPCTWPPSFGGGRDAIANIGPFPVKWSQWAYVDVHGYVNIRIRAHTRMRRG